MLRTVNVSTKKCGPEYNCHGGYTSVFVEVEKSSVIVPTLRAQYMTDSCYYPIEQSVIMPTYTFRQKHRNLAKYAGISALVIFLFIVFRHRFSSPGEEAASALDQRSGKRPAGLEMKDGKFLLNNKPFTILSGAMHYFRVVPELWRDRMLKMKAAGLNTLETYVAWNVHEPEPGNFIFDGMYDLRRYIKLAQEVGLLVIFRPGPYICAEWDLGGLPSWLLRDKDMHLRSSYPPYMEAVDRYIKAVAAQVGNLQYRYGGPIMAIQVENEYGSFDDDQKYMMALKEIFVKHDLQEQLFTSDNDEGVERGSMPGLLTTVNFNDIKSGELLFGYLQKYQADKPMMVMEFWPGWFDHWGNEHSGMDLKTFEAVLNFILKNGASLNFYMFHGGTNFGFMNGANEPYTATITSYDYDAPLSESGHMTPKWEKLRQMLTSYAKGPLPSPPPQPSTFAYGMVKLTHYMSLNTVLEAVTPVQSRDPVTMEMLDINNGAGQGHGFILYQKVIPKTKRLQVIGSIKDRLQVIVNEKEMGVFTWETESPTLEIEAAAGAAKGNIKVQLLVENMGRVNYAHLKSRTLDHECKGLNKEIHADGKPQYDWQIYPLEFKPSFITGLSSSRVSWREFSSKVLEEMTQPLLLQGTLTISGAPKDTFISMQGWTKGQVFVNSFNLGRYWKIGPQQTLYIPAPLLKSGENKIVIFELHKAKSDVTLLERPLLNMKN